MNRIALGLAAAVLGLGLSAGTASAHGHPARVGAHAGAHVHYYEHHATRFSGGWCYAGHDHHHWSRCVWDSAHRRYQYYDPGLCCWYYWSAPYNCYYPVTYCP
jgi:hypothetical protein